MYDKLQEIKKKQRQQQEKERDTNVAFGSQSRFLCKIIAEKTKTKNKYFTCTCVKLSQIRILYLLVNGKRYAQIRIQLQNTSSVLI